MQEIPAMTQAFLVPMLARMSTIHTRIKSLREKRELSMEQLGKSVGVSWQTVQQWENGKTAPKRIRLTRVAVALDTTVNFLLTGVEASSAQEAEPKPKGERFGIKRGLDALMAPLPWPLPAIPRERIEALAPAQLERLQGAIAFALAQVEQDLLVAPKQQPKRGGTVNMDDADDAFPMYPVVPPEDQSRGVLSVHEAQATYRLASVKDVVTNIAPGERPAANDPFDKVPVLGDVRLAAGTIGIENADEDATGHLYFRRSFLRTVDAEGGRARVVYAKGASMEPHIKDGWAALVVDQPLTSVREVTAGWIYAIRVNGTMLMKHIVRDAVGRWVARSSNRSFPDIPLEGDADVRVLGPIRWAGGIVGA